MIVVILTIIGGTGYYVWHSKQASDNSYSAASKTSQETIAKSVVRNYYDCEDTAIKATGNSDTKCKYGNTMFTIPQTFTTDMIRGYRNLPEGAKPKVVKIAKTVFNCGEEPNRYFSEVKVNFVSINKDAVARGVYCDSGYASLVADINGVWKEIAHTQLAYGCDQINKYKIPASVMNECIDIKSQNLIKNTIQ